MICEIFSECDVSVYLLRIAAAAGKTFSQCYLKNLYKIDFLVNNFSHALFCRKMPRRLWIDKQCC